MTGTVVGKYRIVGQLGRGATGIVYRAVDETLDREVAIKILNPSLAAPDVLRRFQAEATVLARLNHPGIATIHELFRADSELLMVMELVRGETLERVVDRLGPLPPDRAAYLVDEILSALEHAHRAGVVHRDIKPANVMLTEQGRLKVMDFGVARARGIDHLASSGLIVGTPAYMAPEQVLGQDVDGRSDLYSVGVILYRLLSGTLPFAAHTSAEILEQQILAAPLPLRAHRHDLPDWCDAIVGRALAKTPDARFQTAASFRAVLAESIGREPTTVMAGEFAAVVRTSPGEPARSPVRTLVMSRTEAGRKIPDSTTGGREVTQVAAPPADVRAWAVTALVVFGAVVGALAYVPVREAETAQVVAEALTAQTIPEVAFETRVLVADGRRQRERVGRLVLSYRRLTVTVDGQVRKPLHSVPFDRVASLSYTRGPDPMWNSPQGPAPVIRGVPTQSGNSAERHWIAVRTNTATRFVILRFENAQIRQVLSALEERTGQTPQLVGKRARTS
jgi:serine/threonine-protein kinase